MKLFLRAVTVFSMVLIIGSLQNVLAQAVVGKVNFVGTVKEANDDGIYSAQFRFRVVDSTCTDESSPKERWFNIKSGRMDGKFVHNSVNTKNAYQTVLTAFLTGSNIQIDPVPNCSNSATIHLNLWQTQIGIF